MLTINRTKLSSNNRDVGQFHSLVYNYSEEKIHLCMCIRRGKVLDEEAQECLQLLA